MGACSQVVAYFGFYSAKHAGLRDGFSRKAGIAKIGFWQNATNGFLFFCVSFLQHTLAEN